MVIHTKNPYAINKEELKTIEVKQLLLQGKPYQPIQTGPIKQILKGIFKRGAKA